MQTPAVSLPVTAGATRWGGWPVVGAAVVLAVVLIVHWPGLHAGALSFDDPEYLTANRLVRNPGLASARRLLGEVLEPSTVHGYYQPLTMISLMVDCALGGRPEYLLPFHRTSLLLHLANTLLVMLLLYRLFGDRVAAGVVGLLFGVHPLTVETIVWVGERKTVLAAFLALLSVAGYLRYVRTGGWWAYAASLGAFALALLAKPTVTPLPVCLLLLDYWPLRRLKVGVGADRGTLEQRPSGTPAAAPPVADWRWVILEKLPFLAVAAASAIITFESQRRTAFAVLPGETLSRPPFYVICHDVVFYLWKMILPIRLSSHYPFPVPLDMSSPAVAAGVIGTTVLTGLLALSWRWTRAMVGGWLFYFVALLPTLGLIGFTNVIASDKYVYWPSFGLMMIGAWAIGRLRARVGGRGWGRRTAIVLVAGICAAAALGVGTRHYLAYWRDTETLFLRMLAMTPGEVGPLDYLGAEYIRQGRGAEAIPLLRAALAKTPWFEVAALHLGDALQQTGDLPGAAAAYRRAIALKPDYIEAHNNLGNVLLALGDTAAARACYERVIGLDEKRADAHYNLANVLVRDKQVEKAEAHYRRAIAIEPGHVAAHMKLGDLHWSRGQKGPATEAYEQVLRYQPGHWELAIRLAEFYVSAKDPLLRRPDRAVELAEQTANWAARQKEVKLRIPAQVCLSRVYRAVGRPDDAAVAARAAMESAQATGDAALMRSVQADLARGG